MKRPSIFENNAEVVGAVAIAIGTIFFLTMAFRTIFMGY